VRVGMYHAASEANQRAIEMDRLYFDACQIAPEEDNYNAYYRCVALVGKETGMSRHMTIALLLSHLAPPVRP
jgi:hypothetical protein